MSTRLSGRRYRRLVSVMVGAALAGAMLSAAPALAAGGAAAKPGSGGLVQIVSPADGAVNNANTVPVTIQLQPSAQPPSLKVMLDFQDVTARFQRTGGHTFQAVLGAGDGLVDGNNVLTATVNGPAHSQSTGQVIFQAKASGLLGGPAAAPPTFPLQTRVVTTAPAEPGDHFEVTVGKVTHPAPAPPAWSCPTGVWVLVLGRGTLNQDNSNVGSADYPLCTTADAKALGTVLAGIPDTDMVIVNSLHHSGTGPTVLNNLGTDALSKIGAVAAEFNGLNIDDNAFSVEGIPGLPQGQAYQVGDPVDSEQSVAAGSPTAASINATLAQDNHANYALAMWDYATYHIDAGGTVTIKGNVIPVPASRAPGFQGGFHVVVVDRRTLSVQSNTLYETNSGDAISEQVRMAADLAFLGEGSLVFLATVGNPVGPVQTPAGVNDPSHCTLVSTYHENCTYSRATPGQLATTLPGGATSVHVVAVGGQGGGGGGTSGNHGGPGGFGAVVTGDFPVGASDTVKPGETLYLVAGGDGHTGGDANGSPGGSNGGGPGGSTSVLSDGFPGGGGGGASDLQTHPTGTGDMQASRLLVAAGGGGGGGTSDLNEIPCTSGAGDDCGGGAGGQPGHSDTLGPGGAGGGAGTATAGGAGGFGESPGKGGTALAGGGGGITGDNDNGAGGGGGGGYFGGGGGSGGGSDLAAAAVAAAAAPT
jgi:hypothetical protein